MQKSAFQHSFLHTAFPDAICQNSTADFDKLKDNGCLG